MLSLAQIRESVRRDLAALFNTVHLASLIGPRALPRGRALGGQLRHARPRGTHRRRASTCPSSSSCCARPSGTSSRACCATRSRCGWSRATNLSRHNSMQFIIEAELWAQPVPLQLFLQDRDRPRGRQRRGRRRAPPGVTAAAWIRGSSATTNASCSYVRELGGGVRARVPEDRAAGSASAGRFECADPYVERLLEAFAFLAARVQLKIDAEFPRFTQHLLEMVYPHYLAPTPSMAVVQLGPTCTRARWRRASWSRAAPRCAAGSAAAIRRPASTAPRTTSTLWPLEWSRSSTRTLLTGLRQLRIPLAQRAARDAADQAAHDRRAAVRASSRSTKLPLLLAGNDEVAMRLYEQLRERDRACIGRAARAAARLARGGRRRRLPAAARLRRRRGAAALRRRARSRATGCCRSTSRSRSASCSSSSPGFERAVRRCEGNELELLVLLDERRRRARGHRRRAAPAAVLHAGDQPVPAPRRSHPPDRGRERVPRRPRPHAADGPRGVHHHQGGRPRHARRERARVPAVLRRARAGRHRPERGAYYTVHAQAARALVEAAPRAGRAPATSAARCSCRWSTAARARIARPAPARGEHAVHQPRPAAAHGVGQRPHRLHACSRARRSRRCAASPARRRRARRTPTATRLAADQPPVAQLPVAHRRRGRARRGRCASC